MKLSSFHALLVAAASLVAHTTADFKVTPEPIVKAATSKHVNYVKQWTLSAGSNTNSIDSLDLSLAGNAYVSYVKGLPAGVIGYVNVSGDSRTVVNAVTVSKDVLDIDNDLDDLFDNDNDGGELNVWLSNKAASGYLLTEIFLASPEAVTDLKSQRSAQVVVEDGVLVKNGKRAELQIDATGSSAVYVSSPKTDVSVRQLSLETTGTASIEYNVNSLNVRSELHMDVQGSSSITVLSSTVKTAQLELETERSGTICISAAEVRATLPKIQGKNQISMPNAGETYGTTGTDVCEEATLPARKAAKITGASASITGLITDLDDDLDNDLDDINDSTEN
ncbi:hypothetical protein PC129_g15659 [Phytophthora cactorum]|uniref:Adhesin domain-containing protein n=1 Tax=Phytophthora cactorum TaxID=29920 RepID=A0A329S0S9_9STRA|nr:hypothetical protein Pcac1_g15167 [Phytophthora cactorum]KAG2807765.1 hypothetical protein PC112_g17260 [Phytophthora cactorum]KAG2810741.1 hypothetical protein PC111_g15518 [Phytophthora cactorum]KAG2849878.1 hypothetical protein PC113_g17299 [Phytophthora cactorum]KAG2887310.1 hypothetical protein PC114_g18870 [Phytophthora cactorum]